MGEGGRAFGAWVQFRRGAPHSHIHTQEDPPWPLSASHMSDNPLLLRPQN